MVALAVIGTAGLTQTFAAEGQTAPAPASTPSTPTTRPASSSAPVVITGKIVVVDRNARTITLEADGKLQLVKVDPKVKMVNKGKLVTLDDLAAGQQVAVLTKVAADGSLQVVALSVEATPAQEPAGAGGNGKGNAFGLAKNGGGGGGGGGNVNSPFVTFPNPANNLGPIVSPEN